MLETKCVDDKFEMLVTDLIVTIIKSPTQRCHQHHCHQEFCNILICLIFSRQLFWKFFAGIVPVRLLSLTLKKLNAFTNRSMTWSWKSGKAGYFDVGKFEVGNLVGKLSPRIELDISLGKHSRFTQNFLISYFPDSRLFQPHFPTTCRHSRCFQ